MMINAVGLAYGAETFDVERLAVESVGGQFEVRSADWLVDQRGLQCNDPCVVVNPGAYPITPAFLDKSPMIIALVGYGVGVDWVDVDDASRRSVMVVNTPHANVEEVAVHSLSLVLACHRRIRDYDRELRMGRSSLLEGGALRRLRGLRFGLLGFGHVARQLAEFVEPFKVTIQAFDPFVALGEFERHRVRPVSFEQLVRSSDLLSVHVPLTNETRLLLDDRVFSQLPRGAIVVITSRGGVYDADALARHLASGHLGGAGLDVFPTEPLSPDHPLTALNNVVLTPHVAGYSEEAHGDARKHVATALAALCSGDVPYSTVNAKQVTRAFRGER